MSEELEQEGAAPAQSQAPQEQKGKIFVELEELQQEIDRIIRDNKRFLERFLDEDFAEENEEEEDEAGEDFEEL